MQAAFFDAVFLPPPAAVAAVLEAVRANDVPINTLHAKGFSSIGCASCTRALAPGEPERNGRWWWEKDGVKECGLHLPQRRP